MQNEFDFSNLPRHAMVVGVLLLAAWFTKPNPEPQAPQTQQSQAAEQQRGNAR